MDCEELLIEIRKWYHDENGGMWLSRKTMDHRYQTLKDRLKEISKSKKSEFPRHDDEHKVVLDQISYFRTLLTADLGTRRKSIFKNKEDCGDSNFFQLYLFF